MSANIPSDSTPMAKVNAAQPLANAIVDMEKEQEGIVLKLLHEINTLKEENKLLRSMVSTSGSPSVSSSSSMPSPTFNDFANIHTNTTGSSPNATMSNSSPFLSQRRSTITTPTNLKRVPPNPSQQSISRSSSLSRPRSRSNSVTSCNIGLPKSNFLDPDYVIRPSSTSSSSSTAKRSHKRSSSDTSPMDTSTSAISPTHSSARLTSNSSKCPKISEGLMVSQTK